MSGGNIYYSTIQVPTPTEELCKDPAKLADLLSKMQLRLNTEFRRFRVVKCPNVRQSIASSDGNTKVQIPNPGFQVGSVFFSHAISTKTGTGSIAQATQTAPGWLEDIVIQTGGGVTFTAVVPNDAPGTVDGLDSYFDVYVVLMEGEGTVK